MEKIAIPSNGKELRPKRLQPTLCDTRMSGCPLEEGTKVNAQTRVAPPGRAANPMDGLSLV